MAWFDIVTVDLYLKHRAVFMIITLGGPLLSMSGAAVIAGRAMRYMKRFKARQGMLCFACDYDLLDGQVQCPECGSEWNPQLLSGNWQKKMQA